jgi:type I restriction enzyme M protein
MTNGTLMRQVINKINDIDFNASDDRHMFGDNRVENEQAWRVSIDTIKAADYNLDLKNPHNPDTGPGDVDHLLPEYEKPLAQIAATREQLKAQLMEALTR